MFSRILSANFTGRSSRGDRALRDSTEVPGGLQKRPICRQRNEERLPCRIFSSLKMTERERERASPCQMQLCGHSDQDNLPAKSMATPRQRVVDPHFWFLICLNASLKRLIFSLARSVSWAVPYRALSRIVHRIVNQRLCRRRCDSADNIHWIFASSNGFTEIAVANWMRRSITHQEH